MDVATQRLSEQAKHKAKLEEEWLRARQVYLAALDEGLHLFEEGKRQESQEVMRKAYRTLKLADRIFHRGMKRMYPRAWPPPKHAKHKTSFKGPRHGK